MKKKNKQNKKKNRLLYMAVLFVGIFTGSYQTVNASTAVPSLGTTQYDEHNGHTFNIYGYPSFCFERGKPFRSAVSDLQMSTTTLDIAPNLLEYVGETDRYGEQINTAEYMRILVKAGGLTGTGGADWQNPFFGGWGKWELNDDRTGLVLISSDNVPSSALVDVNSNGSSVVDKITEDTEDNYVTSTNTSVLNPFDYMGITGHEGAQNAYDVQLKKVNFNQLGILNDSSQNMSMSGMNALAMIKYYLYQDPDADGFSDAAKYKVSQVLTWATQYNFIRTTGADGGYIQIIFQDSYGVYRNGPLIRDYMSCDEFVKKYIGSQYECMKLYRQFVWKMNNLNVIPSFAYARMSDANRDPIHLTWDAEENAYVATLADANGVLDYFDFDINGVEVTKNADGTLKLKSSNKINNSFISTAKSKLLPEDCAYDLPTCWRWELESRTADFTYTAVLVDWDPISHRPNHYSSLGCEWHCTQDPYSLHNCPNDNNAGWEDYGHNDSCERDEFGNIICTINHGGHNTRHEHREECYHKYYCPSYNGTDTASVTTEVPLYFSYDDCCIKEWDCEKRHIKLASVPYPTISVQYQDWQDIISFYGEGEQLVDPIYAYIAVTTDEHAFPCETDVDIQLIDQDGNVATHVKVGEIYKLRYTYTYTGASKGFKIEKGAASKVYYQYYYQTRMQSPNNTEKIYNLKNYSDTAMELVPHNTLYIEPTPVRILGTYSTAETAYPDKMYNFNSESSWNDNICLDALTEEVYDDNYINKTGNEVALSSTNASPQKKSVTAEKNNGVITVTWVYETDYEVFTSAVVNAAAYISIGEDFNYSSAYFDEKYNYGEYEDHNYVGGMGYFSTDQDGNQINSHVITTQNSEYPTYSVKNKVWQSDIDIVVSNFIQNTGAGITEPILQNRDNQNTTHDVNYNLYYTVTVDNPRANIFWNKIRVYEGARYETSDSSVYDTSSDVYEFDLNTLISWEASGGGVSWPGAVGNTVVVDHVKTGITYIQREIPTVLSILTADKALMTMKVHPNYDRLVYEDAYSGASLTGSETDRRIVVTLHDSFYSNNEQSAISDIYAAMNPNEKVMRPQNISGSDNVPNSSDDEHITYGTNGAAGKTSFSIKLSNGEIKTVTDSNIKDYQQYDFTFNTASRGNKVVFVHPRMSAMFFKYSNSSYFYNGDVQSATGVFAQNDKSQRESYYISQVLFKSNYTTKYQKELEAQGAEYVKDIVRTANGEHVTDSWIDMVNQNKFAIVAAGQGFEIRVTVKYENNFLTQYLARYFGNDDAGHGSLGTSNNLGPQYCNISSMTGRAVNDGKNHAYINGFNTLDRLAVNLITGSNVYKDLYCFMSDNPNAVYSYSGIYGTPVIFDRNINYSNNYAVTTITYTMCASTQNGISSSHSKMKFYTNQLAPDKKSPGIVEGNYVAADRGEHSITLWTPVVAATPFDYPDSMQERYIGDAIELGYTIKTTAADDSIVHIVQ